MYKKTTVILMIIIMLTASSCSYRRRPIPPNNQNQQQTPSQNLPKDDKLAKSPKKAVEENINGVGIEEDLEITQQAKKKEEDKIESLSQQQKEQVLQSIEKKNMNTVLQQYNTTLPQQVKDTVKYNEYDISFDYFLITAENGAKIRENPKDDSNIVCPVDNLDKVSLLQRVEGEELKGSNIWYRVACSNGDQEKEGYLHSSEGTPRAFRFNKMQDAVNRLKEYLAQGKLNFISNYKNINGAPPVKGDASVDEFGYRVYHSAPAYERPDQNSSFRYIPDGMLVRILGESGEFYHINVLDFGKDYYVPKKYIDPNVSLSELNNVVVVDRTQQNQAAFEVNTNGLDLISYTLSTTGFKGEYSFETTLGNFKVIEKRDRFQYLKNGTQEIAGYAPYAVRFTGGAYIHGVPVAYREENGQQIDPGTTEYLHTIGTFPRSNMCVRNFTSHAKFLYDWIDSKNAAVIVIE